MLNNKCGTLLCQKRSQARMPKKSDRNYISGAELPRNWGEQPLWNLKVGAYLFGLGSKRICNGAVRTRE